MNLIKFLKAYNELIPVYSFYIPEDAKALAMCFENAGQGVATNYHNGSEIKTRTIKLTVSSNDIADIYQDEALTKYISTANKVGDLTILKARVINFTDLFDNESKIYERTYSIQFKYKVN